MIYIKMLEAEIEREINGTGYAYSAEDKAILEKMFAEIKLCTGWELYYLSEAAALNLKGTGALMSEYVESFASEDIRCILAMQMVSDKIKDCDKLVLRLYKHFKASDKYIAKPNRPSPVHIYVRYDDAFRRLKPKRLKAELMELASDPRDASYLPFTVRMLASWRIPELKEILISYLDGTSITAERVGMKDDECNYYPSLDTIKRGLLFTAIYGLGFYPAADTVALIEKYASDSDRDICAAAQKSLKKLKSV